MYTTCFIRTDGRQSEEYRYKTKEEAVSHLHLFAEDSSGLFRSISVVNDERNIVLCVLVPAESDVNSVFSMGDIVRLVPEYASENERGYIYSITNINNITMRVDITCLNSGAAIPATETVGLNMIRHVSDAGPINLDEFCRT